MNIWDVCISTIIIALVLSFLLVCYYAYRRNGSSTDDEERGRLLSSETPPASNFKTTLKEISDSICVDPTESRQERICTELAHWTKWMWIRSTPTIIERLLSRAPDSGISRVAVVNFFAHFDRRDGLTLRRAFTYILQHCNDSSTIYPLLSIMEDSSVKCSAQHYETLGVILQFAHNFMSSSCTSESQTGARSKFTEAFRSFLDDHKRLAFDAAFIQPTLIVYGLSGHQVEYEDVAVHGILP
jgi:hypothetical protein